MADTASCRVPYGKTTVQSPAQFFNHSFCLRPAPWQLASAAAACLLLHTVMNVCLQPKQPAPVPGGLAGVATLLASGTTGLASFPWKSLLTDMTVSGSAAASHRCASRLPCCDATSAPAAGSQPPWEGLGRAPCDMLHHELASCSSQAHRLRVHTDSLQQQQANCAAELRQAKATAAAAAFMRLWASLASAACVVLAVQLRAKSQKGAGEGDTQLPDEQQATGGSSAPGACLTLQAVQSSQIEPGAVGGPGTRPPLRAGTRAGQQQQQRLSTSCPPCTGQDITAPVAAYAALPSQQSGCIEACASAASSSASFPSASSHLPAVPTPRASLRRPSLRASSGRRLDGRQGVASSLAALEVTKTGSKSETL